jgi:hypothetical protein
MRQMQEIKFFLGPWGFGTFGTGLRPVLDWVRER